MNIALTYHLQYNHYPPVTAQMVPYCEEAIQAVTNGEPETMIEFPNGEQIAAWDLVEDLHLDEFVYQGDY